MVVVTFVLERLELEAPLMRPPPIPPPRPIPPPPIPPPPILPPPPADPPGLDTVRLIEPEAARFVPLASTLRVAATGMASGCGVCELCASGAGSAAGAGGAAGASGCATVFHAFPPLGAEAAKLSKRFSKTERRRDALLFDIVRVHIVEHERAIGRARCDERHRLRLAGGCKRHGDLLSELPVQCQSPDVRYVPGRTT